MADSAKLKSGAIPQHVAIIMDGNRRWAKQRKLSPAQGHAQGVVALAHAVEAALDLGVRALTVYGFSTENWLRSEGEVSGLLKLINESAKERCDQLTSSGVRLGVIGDLSHFPKSLRDQLRQTQALTSKGQAFDLILALNYGARDDIRRAAIAVAHDIRDGRIAAEDLSEERFATYLDTAPWPDPDMLIRTSGEYRLSNFLLWQLSYAEVIVTETLWPDFDREAFYACVEAFQKRERRLGA